MFAKLRSGWNSSLIVSCRMHPSSSIVPSSQKHFTDTSFLNICQLFTPLRFDFLVRIDFLKLYKEHRDLYRTHHSEFMELAQEHLYFFQHTKVKVANRTQNWAKEEELASYEQKVDEFIGLV